MEVRGMPSQLLGGMGDGGRDCVTVNVGMEGLEGIEVFVLRLVI